MQTKKFNGGLKVFSTTVWNITMVREIFLATLHHDDYKKGKREKI